MIFPEIKELKKLSAYNTPQKIQTLLETIPFNYEKKGETCMSALRVLREQKAHCIEGAFLACACLLEAGREPLIVSLKVKQPEDDDHILALFKEQGLYGAISKTNHAVLRYRDPLYRTVRELIMSYFHEYFLFAGGEKTLLGYTRPINLKRFGRSWITSMEDQWEIAEKIFDTTYISIVPEESRRFLRNASAFEQKVLKVREW